MDIDDASVISGSASAIGSGRLSSATTAGGNIIGFSGYVWEEATGLYLSRHRWYSPQTGRWLNRDLLHYPDGPSLYAYVAGDPINFTDPSGLAAQEPRYFHNVPEDMFQHQRAQAKGPCSARDKIPAGIDKSKTDRWIYERNGYIVEVTHYYSRSGDYLGTTRTWYGPNDVTEEQMRSIIADREDQSSGTAEAARVTAAGAELYYSTLAIGVPGPEDVALAGAAGVIYASHKAFSGGKRVANAAKCADKVADACGASRGAARTQRELVQDFKENPGDWERVAAQVGPSTALHTRGQPNVETQWRNKKTGETLSTHEVGGPVNPHPENASPNLPEGGAVRPGNKAKELKE